MNSFLAWVGGKKSLRDAVLARFPPEFDRYIEVFGGAGWVLFHKPPDGFEVFNDYNSLLVNLYRCVRDRPQELMHELQYVLNAREDFMYLAELHKAGRLDELPDIKRAACFYQLIRYSYGCGLTSFASKPHSIWRDFPLIDRASHRLQSVVIENQDFEQLIRHYDSPGSFFYCDPPYYATEDYYMDVGFTKHDHMRLRNAVLSSQGKFLISYNDCPEIREIWAHPRIRIEQIRRLDNLRQRYDSGAMYEEIFISNYNTSERGGQYRQLTLLN